MQLKKFLIIGTAACVVIGVAVIGATVMTQSSRLPFLGESSVLGGVPAERAVLLRQADCSLTQRTFYPLHMIANSANFQNTLHTLGGVKSTGNVFAHGCKDPTLGVPSTITAWIGTNAAGQDVMVQAAANTTDLRVETGSPISLTHSSTTLATNVSPQVLAVDLNGDGILDIVGLGIADPNNSASVGVGVFLGNKDGSYQPATVYPLNNQALGTQIHAFTIDDVNGDGKPDLLVPNHTPGGTGEISVFIGKGDGTFTAGPSLATVTADQMFITGDFNGDGKKDLLAGDGTLYVGHGDGSFAAGTAAFDPGSASGFVSGMTTNDFNGDGKPDVAIVGAFGGVQVFQGHGDGTFTIAHSYASIENAISLFSTDVDGDGSVDLLVARISNGGIGPGTRGWTYQVMMGRGDLSFSGPNLTVNPAIGGVGGIRNGLAFSEYALADLNGDGHVDLLAPAGPTPQTSAPNALSVSPGNGDGTFGTALASNLSFMPVIVAAADFNKDGKMDAVAVGPGNSGVVVGTVFGAGDDTLAGELDYPLPSGSGLPASVAVGDFNGDGYPDIAVGLAGPPVCGTGCTGGVYVLYGKADHTFTTPALVDNANRALVVVGDINADGVADLVVTDTGVFGATPTPGSVHIYLGKAGGTLTSAGSAATGLYFSSIVLTDFNKDGKLDILAGATNAPGGQTQIDLYAGKGDGTFGAPLVHTIPGGDADPAPVLAVGDFDADGNPDVAFFLSGDFSGVFYGAGDGTLGAQVNFELPFDQADWPMALDLNGDGRTDLVVTLASQFGLVSFINQGPVATTPPSSPPPAAPDFSVSLAPAAGTVVAGGTLTTTVTVTPANGFAQTVALACANPPSDVTCSFSPASVAVGGGVVTSTLTISTTVRSAANQPDDRRPLDPVLPSGMLLAGLMPAVLRRGRRGRRDPRARQRYGRVLVSIAWVCAGAALLHGCSGDHAVTVPTGSASGPPVSAPPATGTPAGSYSISLSATSGSLSHTVTYALTVT